jgi:hypothetical protein
MGCRPAFPVQYISSKLNQAPRDDLPDGLFFSLGVQPSLQKYFRSRFGQIKIISATVSSHQKGRLAIVTNAGRDAVDADVLRTNGTKADGEVVWF